MSSVSGVSGSDPASIAMQIAEQNRKSASAAASTSSSDANNVLSRLNALYGSDGTNQAKNSMDDVAGLLGVNSDTLTSELQGPNASKVKELMGQAALLKTFENSNGSSSGNLFDTTA
jgi:hypothetical protein